MYRVDHQSTKIIATVGPASSSPEMLYQLAHAGVDVFRLNFSHGTHEEHEKVIHRICAINEENSYHIGILADLQGPKIRIGKISNDIMPIGEGDVLMFNTEPCEGDKSGIHINYNNFPKDVKPGERILIDDGKLVMEVLETDGEQQVKLKVIHGGELSSNKGVNLPDTVLTLPSITEKDKKDLEFILKQPINWIALSFVRTAEDIIHLLEFIKHADHPAKVIAKIEKPEALEDIDRIIKVSNAIMVARGDLGVEVPIETLPSTQKSIITKCIHRSRPVIVATQMMDSMINNPSPTRAEVTDVANAVHDGADAVMLSGETSVGKYPLLVVEAMNRIIDEAEKHFIDRTDKPVPSNKSRTFLSDVVCFNAAKTADEINAKAIIGMTSSGYTAFKISSFRPKMKIFIFSDKSYMLSTLNLVWGVHGFYYDRFTTTDETIYDVVSILKKMKLLEPGDVVVNTGSMPIEKQYRTNMLKVTLID